jgi:tetratricopeptide (TPR) repeat protein
MENRGEQQIWQRIEAGRHTAVIGPSPKSPPASINLVRVSCDAPSRTLGPVFEAQREIEHVLGATPMLEQPVWHLRQRVITGLRRRLLGDLPEVGVEGELVDACNRLLQHTQAPYALVLDALEAADEHTLELLTRVILRRGWLRLPLLLVFRKQPEQRAAARLLASLGEVEGPDAIVSLQPRDEAGTTQPLAGKPTSWRSLPPDVLQVLRAGVVIGQGFEDDLVADLLGTDLVEVYDCLQRAWDAGVPLEDRGEGRFFLPDAWMDALRSSILPSLVAVWHRRLGVILAESEARTEMDPGSRAPAASARDREGAADAVTVEIPVVRSASRSAARSSMKTGTRPEERAPGPNTPDDTPAELSPPATSFASVFDASQSATAAGAERPGPAATPAAAAVAAPPVAEPPVAEPWLQPQAQHQAQPQAEAARAQTARPHAARPHAGGHVAGEAPQQPKRPSTHATQRGVTRDPARAASHLSAAGDVEAAAERYMIAAGQAAAVGAFGQAMEHVRRALLLVERLPATPERRAFRIRTLLTLARLQWQAVDPTPEMNVAFTLQSALQTVDGVIESLQNGDPADLIAEARALAAGICYDLGDVGSLARALEELTQASKLLLDGGDSVGAARLLNDQAAVFVRLGDPVRATHLLAQSQRVFESRADSDPVTMTELAETHHLLARLPFHAKIRSGHEADAVSMGMDHARTAERWYRKLGASRELARVWESMGRLELLRQRAEQAAEHLSRALQVQGRIGDVTGLARTTAAMSEVLTMQGLHRNALMVLGDSIALNLDKGSPIGLAFNRRAYDALRRELADVPSPDVQRALVEVGSQLERAEGMLGRVPLPDAALT